MGEPAEILRHLLEIRGVGIIDVMSLYGASAVKDSSQVQIAVYLENYAKDQVYDRLGNNAEELEIGGVTIPRIRIPVKTGPEHFGRDRSRSDECSCQRNGL